LGYVGLPLSIRFSQEKFTTVGFDIDINKVNILNSGKSYIKHINEDKIQAIIDKKFRATADFNEINNVDAIIICVPTPLDNFNKPDLSYIHSTLENIKNNLREKQLLILESTTYPGTTEEEIVPFIKKNPKLIIGNNFFIGYSPEREDPGNKYFSTKTIPKVISGVTENCKELTNFLYKQIVDETVPVTSPKVAEMTKILENIHRAVNIGLVNELKMVADKMGIDIYEVINAAKTKPFGFTPFYPGPGLGGHCIPIDPFYLSWKAKQIGVETRFIELAGEINASMPNYVVSKVEKALKLNNKSISDSKILVLGLSYKKNIDDTRESPSYAIISALFDKKANVQYSDPFFPIIPRTRKYKFNLSSVELTASNINSFDLVLISTDHDVFDYDLILKESKVIVDTRGVMSSSKKVLKA
jgi:UDP-N-acetyl-D-glucosamine dehydrogenase